MSSNGAPVGLGCFFLVLGVLTAIRILYGVIGFPSGLVMPMLLLSAVLFVAGPVIALAQGARPEWHVRHAAFTFTGGALIHASAAYFLMNVYKEGLPSVLIDALGNAGLLTWCLGLGAMVGLLIKDKNMLLPVAFFLAGFDVFLVFNPTAIVTRVVTENPEMFERLAASVPAAQPANTQQGITLAPMAFVGPADFFFSAVFLVCLYRFGMRARETMKWLTVALTLYLVVVLSPLGLNMLPALVPIGLTVLLVNRKEFVLTKEEKQATWGAGFIALALAGYGIYRKFTVPVIVTEPPAAPVTQEPAPEPQESADSPPIAL
ncbi:MAG: hypothetical protein KF812_04975 [Fimbriimonadaceae bacterium]|nr:hypothetical protein [Fimbriimonadaceae bacterium]